MELTLVFQILFLSLLLVLLIGMVLYQEVKLQSLAVRASERGSVVYGARVEDMTKATKTIDDFEERDPYRDFPLLGGGDKQKYTALVNDYVNAELGKKDILNGDGSRNVKTEVKNYIIEKRISVSINDGYVLPLPIIGETFGHSGPFDVDTVAVSAVLDSPEFVRNVDIVTDIAKHTDFFGTVQNGYSKIKEAIQKVTDLLQ